MQETQIQFLGWEDHQDKEVATHSSSVAWRMPWTEKPGGLQSTVSQRVGHNWAPNANTRKHSDHDQDYFQRLAFI